MLLKRLLPLALMSTLLVSPALAQGTDAPAVQAVVALLNVLDHPAVVEVSASLDDESSRSLAAALLKRLEEHQTIAPDLAEAISAELDTPVLPRDAFVLYLADLLNGSAVLETREVVEAEQELRLRLCGIQVPSGSASATHEGSVLSQHDVGDVVDQVVASYECIHDNLRDIYDDPVE